MGDVLQEPDAGSQAADASRMRDVMSRCGALGSERPRASFKTNNLEQDLTRLLKSGNVEQHRDVLERKLASSALAGGHFKCWLFLQFSSHQQYFVAISSVALVIGVPISHALGQKSNAALWTEAQMKKRSKKLLDYVIQSMQVSGQAQTKQHSVVQHTICACQLSPDGDLDMCQQITESGHVDSERPLSTGTTLHELLLTCKGLPSQVVHISLPRVVLGTAGVMAFSEVLADVGNHGKYSLSLYDMGRFMRLDAAAQRALNVMKTKFDANDNFSLYGLMSRARTSMGKRLLKASLTALFE